MIKIYRYIGEDFYIYNDIKPLKWVIDVSNMCDNKKDIIDTIYKKHSKKFKEYSIKKNDLSIIEISDRRYLKATNLGKILSKDKRFRKLNNACVGIGYSEFYEILSYIEYIDNINDLPNDFIGEVSYIGV